MGGRLSLTGTTDGGRGEGVVLMVILCVEGRGEGGNNTLQLSTSDGTMLQTNKSGTH